MKRSHLSIYALLLVSAIAFVIFIIMVFGSHVLPSYPSNFVAGGRAFNITAVASNPAEWEHGLMNATVTNSTLMVFLFPNASVYSFWMFDTHYPLDIIWVLDGRVVYIARDVPPCIGEPPSSCPLYTPTSAANVVVEAEGGFAARNNISVGERVSLSG